MWVFFYAACNKFLKSFLFVGYLAPVWWIYFMSNAFEENWRLSICNLVYYYFFNHIVGGSNWYCCDLWLLIRNPKCALPASYFTRFLIVVYWILLMRGYVIVYWASMTRTVGALKGRERYAWCFPRETSKDILR